MEKTEAKSKIQTLSLEINKHNHLYYVLDQPFLEDVVFDRLYRELLELEKKYPSLVTLDSPSQRLGGKPSLNFKNIKHRIPLLSLDNAFDFNELTNWYERVYKLLQQNFEEADRFTSARLRELAGDKAVSRGYVYFSEVDSIPVIDLTTLNKLWIIYSRGKFGFTVQAKILNSVGGRYD